MFVTLLLLLCSQTCAQQATPSFESCIEYCLPGDACWPAGSVWETELGSVLGTYLEHPHVNGPFYSGSGVVAAKLKSSLGVADTVTKTAASAAIDVCPRDREADISFRLRQKGFCLQEQDCTKKNCNGRASYGDGGEPQYNIPAYVAMVETVADIQACLAFANKYNIQVTVKTSGHSYSGSSSGYGSLNIHLLNLYGIGSEPIANFMTNGTSDILFGEGEWADTCGNGPPNNRPETDSGKVIRLSGGASWQQAYNTVRDQYLLVGGGGLTVGAAGGWLQGSGLSPWIRKYGYGIDNVLQFDVVLTNGTLVTADACSNEDLFWALRGGGGGAFGIVVSVVYRLHKVVKIQFLSLSFDWTKLLTLYPANAVVVADTWIDFWVATSPSLDNRWGGYFNLLGIDGLYFAGPKTDPAYSTFVSKLEAMIEELPSSMGDHAKLTQHNDISSYFDSRLPSARDGKLWSTDITNQASFNIGAYTVPLDMVEQRPWKITPVLKKLVRLGQFGSTFNYFLGGEALANETSNLHARRVENADNDSTVVLRHNTTAVGPQMRSSIWQLEVFNEMSAHYVRDALADEPEAGCGYNHGSKKEPDWQNCFFGRENYKRLLQVKAAYDPAQRMNCHHCVGWKPVCSPKSAGLLTKVTGWKQFHLLSSVRIIVGGKWERMSIAILRGSPDGMDDPQFITGSDAFPMWDWKPMYSPGKPDDPDSGNTMVTFFRTFNSDYSQNTTIIVIDSAEKEASARGISTAGANFNPTWLRGDYDRSDEEKRVVWVRMMPRNDKTVCPYCLVAWMNCASCSVESEMMITNKNAFLAFGSDDNLYSMQEWPMTSLHDGRLLILRNFEYKDKSPRMTRLYTMTLAPDGSGNRSDTRDCMNLDPELNTYQEVEFLDGEKGNIVPTSDASSWNRGHVHKLFPSPSESYIAYQRNGDEGEDHSQSSLCYARMNVTAVRVSIWGEVCFVQNNPEDGVTDWYPKFTHDEENIVFSSNRDPTSEMSQSQYHVFAFNMETKRIFRITGAQHWYDFWYTSTYGLTTYWTRTNQPIPVATTDVSVTTTEMSVTTTEMSVTTAKMSVPTTEMSVTSTKKSAATTETSVTTTEMSVTTTEMSVTTAKMSVPTTEMSVTTNFGHTTSVCVGFWVVGLVVPTVIFVHPTRV
eukprot:TRINITY_DN3377_c0_g1_i2.p1 TRINITY_DN3377_c0_g1~~TRINITY_DN3377_c0_g1_i2.p1  ORF type:complete len:1150 (-),score=136.84 TRINITY_DN3377_c0_g1_i2:30-3479(-)